MKMSEARFCKTVLIIVGGHHYNIYCLTHPYYNHLHNIRANHAGSSCCLLCSKVVTEMLSATAEILSQQQILGTGNLPQDSAPVCINIDISPEMATQSAQRNQAFCATASDWSPIKSA